MFCAKFKYDLQKLPSSTIFVLCFLNFYQLSEFLDFIGIFFAVFLEWEKAPIQWTMTLLKNFKLVQNLQLPFLDEGTKRKKSKNTVY